MFKVTKHYMSAKLKIYDPYCIINDLVTKQDLEILKKDIIIKLGSFIISAGIAVSAFLAWFLPIAITNALR